MLTVFFYVPILAMEIRSSFAVEGINYVADRLLFAASALLAGFGFPSFAAKLVWFERLRDTFQLQAAATAAAAHPVRKVQHKVST